MRGPQGVSCARIRDRADLAQRRSVEEAQADEEARSVSWWFHDEGRRFGLEADLPASQGAVVASALHRLTERIPVMPGEEDRHFACARRADALVALASQAVADDPDPDRATVVVHAPVEALRAWDRSCEVEGGGLIQAETVRRLACTGRVQVVVEDGARNPTHVGPVHRDPPRWMVRQLRYRDRGCTFPGCGTRLFTHAHHVVWWEHGGPTTLDNLVLVCSFHHRLVQEDGWSLRREPDGAVKWFRPDGTGYRAGPGPPGGAIDCQPALTAAAGF